MDTVEKVIEKVKQHPYTAMAVSFILGALIF